MDEPTPVERTDTEGPCPLCGTRVLLVRTPDGPVMCSPRAIVALKLDQKRSSNGVPLLGGTRYLSGKVLHVVPLHRCAQMDQAVRETQAMKGDVSADEASS